MPKIPSIPRISIVVPVNGDVHAFEDTLVSVLENQPSGSEVVVAHDGHYDDPFGLDGEVRLVTAASTSLVDLIAAGITSTRAKFVHVLAPGFQAVDDWTRPAMEQFDFGAATVAPVIRDADNRVVAAGWTDTAAQLCKPNGAGRTKIDRTAARSIVGSYLQASFWRCDVLKSLINAFHSSDAVESTYAFAHLANQAGWECALASDCNVVTSLKMNTIDPSSYNRGRTLRAIRKAVTRDEAKMPLLINLLRSLTGSHTIGETFGQANYRGKLANVKRELHPEQVLSNQHNAVIPMRSTAARRIRRAA